MQRSSKHQQDIDEEITVDGNISLFSEFEKEFLAFSYLLIQFIYSDLSIETLIILYFILRAFNTRGQAHFGRLDPGDVAQELG